MPQTTARDHHRGHIGLLSLHRIRLCPAVGESCGKSSTSGGAQGGRIGATAFGKRSLHRTFTREQPRQAVIPLVAPGLRIESIRFVTLLA